MLLEHMDKKIESLDGKVSRGLEKIENHERRIEVLESV